MKIETFLPMNPPTCTHQEKRVSVVRGKPHFYDPPKVAAARQKLTALLVKAAPESPMTGPLRLVVRWCFPRGKGHKDGEYRATKPDTDNLQKLLKDCLTAARWWKDDAQVASELAEKFWAEVPGIYVRVEEAVGSCLVTDD